MKALAIQVDSQKEDESHKAKQKSQTLVLLEINIR